MVNDLGTNKEQRRLVKLKWIIAGFAIIQIYRILMLGFTFYVIYDSLIVQKVTPPMFDQASEDYLQVEASTNDSLPSILDMYDVEAGEVPFKRLRRYSEFYDYNEPGDEVTTKARSDVTWSHVIQLTIPVVEVLASLVVLSLIFGPLSVKVSPKMWIIWIVNMRIFWMRLLWTATAIAFVVITTKYHEMMYKITSNPRYLANLVVEATMAMTAVEYCVLGIVETTIKIMSMDRLKSRIDKLEKKISYRWWLLLRFDYYTCLMVFVLRNFVMSLYFGILTAFVTQDTVVSTLSEDTKDVMGNVTVVLQIYLALIRGRFYGFFMHNFLSNFFVEEGDVMFKVNKESGDVIRRSTVCDEIYDKEEVCDSDEKSDDVTFPATEEEKC